jgi:hypothetical protein
LKRVDLPTFGSPTIPIVRAIQASLLGSGLALCLVSKAWVRLNYVPKLHSNRL